MIEIVCLGLIDLLLWIDLMKIMKRKGIKHSKFLKLFDPKSKDSKKLFSDPIKEKEVKVLRVELKIVAFGVKNVERKIDCEKYE